MGGINWICVVSFLIVVPMSLGLLTINPQKYEIDDVEFNKTYNIMITPINPDTNQYDVQIIVNKESEYLFDNINIEPTHFSIGPNDKENIKLGLDIPEGLSPEEHILYLDFLSGTTALGRFKLSFTVPGVKHEDLVVTDVNTWNQDSLVYFDFKLKNNGNVIARASPYIQISKDSVLDSFGEESTLIIMPGEEYNLSLMYDTTNLAPGEYSFDARFRYNDLETNHTTGTFFATRDVEDAISDTIYAEPGEIISINRTIFNPGEGLTFYRISYSVEGTDIQGTIEGQMQEQSKEVLIDIDMQGLGGEYTIRVQTEYGRNLELYEETSIGLFVEKKSSIWLIITLILLSFGLGAVYMLRPSKSPDTQVLEHDISELRRRYTHIESQMQGFNNDIHNFINASNNWLRTHGYHNGFR